MAQIPHAPVLLPGGSGYSGVQLHGGNQDVSDDSPYQKTVLNVSMNTFLLLSP